MKAMLDNQVAIITGAARGIGAATARLFAQEGAQVVVNDLDAATLAGVVDEIKANGGVALAVPGGVTEAAFPEQLIKAAIDAFGKINILVNNAGYTWDAMIHKMTDEQWQAMLDVHATAPFRMIRAVAPYMRDVAKAEIQEQGAPREPRCIVNISSTSGLHGNIGQANYAMGKLGIVGLTKTVAKEWGPLGIRCNAVAFGFVDTRLTQSKAQGASIQIGEKAVALGIPEATRETAATRSPLGRPATPEEAASGILLMASPLASYITGHTLEVTGGAGI
ncbi:MAG: SDR family oxidoreductase [Chloroflexi bacterium]|nr:SDR family oxidoreductase [Chloroflexota bacterium]